MTPPVLPSSPADLLDGLVEQAIQDLAVRVSISVDQIELIEAREVVWPNGSLGCPQPGMIYAQLITPGYRIILKVEKQFFEYHSDLNSFVVFCETEGTTPGKVNPAVQDGWPNQPKDGDVVITTPLK